MKKKRRNVVCRGCAYFFRYRKCKFCLYKASFISSPIDKKHDLGGVRHAVLVNTRNNCKHKRLFSLRSFFVKLWILQGKGERKKED